MQDEDALVLAPRTHTAASLSKVSKGNTGTFATSAA